MGILAAVVSHGRPRVRSFIRVSFMPLYFMTGVIFPIHKVPPQYLDWFLWNPMLHLVELSRHSFILEYQTVAGVNLLYPLGCTLLVSALGLSVYRVNRLRLITST
jgi:capsular polysaccharide transport system permease protein